MTSSSTSLARLQRVGQPHGGDRGDPALRRERPAVGGYGGALPSRRAKLDIGASEIALALFLAGAAGITSMQIGGRLADSLGARKVTLVGLPVLIAGAVTLGLAPTFPVAVIGAMLIGFGNGALDVAMNAIGVQVESARGRAIMSFFHAMWSVGNFIGAGHRGCCWPPSGPDRGEVVTPLMLVLGGLAVAV